MAMDPEELIPVLMEDLKLQIITEFNLQPGGYDDAYLTKAMTAFSRAISNKVIAFIQENAEVNPIKNIDPSVRLLVDVPASGGGFITREVYGLGKVD